MKKRLTLICALLVAIMAFGTSCANTDFAKVIPEYSYHENTHVLQSLTKDDLVDSCDELGLMIVETLTYDEEDNLQSTKQRLYNSKTDAFIEGATVEVVENFETPVGEYHRDIGLIKITDGMYAIVNCYYAPKEGVGLELIDVLFTIFGKNGKVGEIIYSDLYEYQNYLNSGVLSDDTGVRYYVNVKGNVVKENNPLTTVLTYSANVSQLKDYYLSEYNFDLFDKEGKFVRSIDLGYELGMGSVADDEEIWYVENSILVQYTILLPSDAKDYDYQELGEDYQILKYDLVTKRYDVEKEKVYDLEMNFKVNSWYAMFDESVILCGREIKDKQLCLAEIVQCFDANGKVALDIQKLVPGAYEVEMSNEYAVISSVGGISVVKGNEVVWRIGKNAINEHSIIGNSVIVHNSGRTKFSIYDFSGQLKKTYDNIVEYKFMYGLEYCLLIETENSIVEYNLTTHEETIYVTFDGTTSVASIKRIGYAYEFYIEIVRYGEDQELGTEDDVNEIVFLFVGMETITTSQNQVVDIGYIDNYYEYKETQSEDFMIFRVAIYDVETGEETVSYYRYQQIYEISEEK